jgi:two-component system response regulator MprA
VSRLLLIDDDKKLLALLERGFKYEGFEVLTATTGAHGLAVAHAEHPDVVLLDIGMTDVDGYAVCRQLRASLDVPVIMLTARDEVEDKVRALGLGADDYVTKPFAFDELAARIRAVLRRTPARGDMLTFADLTVDLTMREVTRQGRTIALTGREFDLLVTFLRHPRQVLTREVLLQGAWGYDFGGETKVVDVYIGYLRQKLGEPRLIHTIRGVGYALRAPQDGARG